MVNIYLKFISIYLLFEVLIDIVSFGIDGTILAIIVKATSAYGIVVIIDNLLQKHKSRG